MANELGRKRHREDVKIDSECTALCLSVFLSEKSYASKIKKWKTKFDDLKVRKAPA